MTQTEARWLIFASLCVLLLGYAQTVGSVVHYAAEPVYAASEPQIATSTATTTELIEAEPEKPTDVEGLIEWYAAKNGASYNTSYWIARCESELKNVPNRNGAIYGQGVFQFIQTSWDALCEGDVWDIEDNINCGTKLIAAGALHHWGTAYTDWGSHACWSPHI